MTAIRHEAPRRGAGFILQLLLISVALFGGFVLVTRVGDLIPSFETTQVDRTSPALLEALEDVERYRAATANFEVIVDLERDIENVPSWIAGERTVMVAVGSVDAEVDFSGLDRDAVRVDEANGKVEIVLPRAVLTEARIDNDNTYVATRERGLLDRVNDAVASNPVDDQGLYVLAEERLGEAAAASDVRDRAEENTRAMLVDFVSSLGYDDVTVTFVTSPGR